MKTCPECAEEVQDAAKVCRYCGYDFIAKERPHRSAPRKSGGAKGCLTMFAILIAIPVLWAIAEGYERSDAETPNTSAAVVINETPSDMVKLYSENEASAKALYDGATVRITGLVGRVSLNATDGVIVDINDGEASVSAHLLESQKSWSKGLRPGNAVSLYCNEPYYLLGILSLSHCMQA